MVLQARQTVRLLDRHSRCLGTVAVEQVEGDLVLGTFAVTVDFAPVEPLFSEFVEAADDQLFHRVDELDAIIAGLGLHLEGDNGTLLPAIGDVQIGGRHVSFRVCSGEERNGMAGQRGKCPAETPLS